MDKSALKKDDDQTPLYPIRVVSDITGVNAVTLRAWERRHGLFEPIRKPSGHRLYTQETIDLISRIVGLLDRGIRISQVKAHLLPEESPGDEQAPAQNVWKAPRDRMLSAVIRFSEAELDETYEEALSKFPVEVVTEKLLTPVLNELGLRWSNNEGSVAEEHFFGVYIRNKLGARLHHRKKSFNGPGVLLACLPGDRHETGLLLFSLAATEIGYHTILLGSDMPLDELPAAVKKTGCVAIVLSGMILPSLQILNRDLPRLMEQVDVPVFMGGQASLNLHGPLKQANIHVLGTDLVTGLQRFQELVPLANQEN